MRWVVAGKRVVAKLRVADAGRRRNGLLEHEIRVELADLRLGLAIVTDPSVEHGRQDHWLAEARVEALADETHRVEELAAGLA